MLDSAISGAGQSILDVGIVGAVCILLIALVVFQDRRHRAEIAKKDEDLAEEREAHQTTRLAQIEDIRTFAKLGEAAREQMRATEIAIDALRDVMRRSA